MIYLRMFVWVWGCLATYAVLCMILNPHSIFCALSLTFALILTSHQRIFLFLWPNQSLCERDSLRPDVNASASCVCICVHACVCVHVHVCGRVDESVKNRSYQMFECVCDHSCTRALCADVCASKYASVCVGMCLYLWACVYESVFKFGSE